MNRLIVSILAAAASAATSDNDKPASLTTKYRFGKENLVELVNTSTVKWYIILQVNVNEDTGV